MKTLLQPCQLAWLLSLLFLCSCATVPPPLPAAVRMNPGAGRGVWLLVMVRLEGGEPMPFIVDTGSPVTCLDQSLEPQLGRRLTDANFLNFGVLHPGGTYRPPKFYLGDTPLRNSGKLVVTLDCRPWAGVAHVPFKGFLGMDVLKNYCLQLDFQASQLRFLDAQHADKKDWGRPFPLTGMGDGCFAISGNLVGAKGPRSMIDTGDDYDGNLTPQSFQLWMDHATPPAGGEARSPDGTLGGEMYHELKLRRTDETDHDAHSRFNTIGFHVLSRNLVTLDFPKHTLYLKHTGDSPLAN